MRTIDLSCAVCGSVTSYEQPPCPDGHATECPEWTCSRCGDALLLDPPPIEGEAAPSRPVERRAA